MELLLRKERRRTILRLLPLLLLLICVGGWAMLVTDTDTGNLNPARLLACVVCVGLVYAGVVTRRLPDQTAVYLLLGIFSAFLLIRINTVLQTAVNTPNASVMSASYLIAAFNFLFIGALLPYPRSIRLAVVFWLAVSALTGYWCLPQIDQPDAPAGVVPLLVCVWLGFPAFLAVLSNQAGSMHRVFELCLSTADQARRASAVAQQEKSEARHHAETLDAMFAQAAVGVALLDPQGHWLRVNDKVCTLLGRAEDELLGTDFQHVTHPDDLDRDLELANKVMARELPSYSIEKRYLKKDGSLIWAELSVGLIEGDDHEQDRFVSVITDISSRKAAQQRLSALQSGMEAQIAERTAELVRTNAQVQQLAEMIGVLQASNSVGDVFDVAKGFLPAMFPDTSGCLYQYDPEQDCYSLVASWGAYSSASPRFTNADCWAARRSNLHVALTDGKAPRCKHLTDDTLPVSQSCIPLHDSGQASGVLSVLWESPKAHPDDAAIQTVAEQLSLTLANVALRARLTRQATYDALTGLFNRRHLAAFLHRTCSQALRSGAPLSVVTIDIDHFKQVNDTYGHAAGDMVLRNVAAAIQSVVRDGDAAFRSGGEEFVVVMPHTFAEAARIGAERILQAIRALALSWEGATLDRVTASLGVSGVKQIKAGDDGPDKIETWLLSTSDHALYAAKRGGRNQIKVYSAADEAEAQASAVDTQPHDNTQPQAADTEGA